MSECTMQSTIESKYSTTKLGGTPELHGRGQWNGKPTLVTIADKYTVSRKNIWLKIIVVRSKTGNQKKEVKNGPRKMTIIYYYNNNTKNNNTIYYHSQSYTTEYPSSW